MSRTNENKAPPFLRLHLYGLFRHPNAFVMRNQVPTDFCSSRQDLCARLSAGYGGMKSVGNRRLKYQRIQYLPMVVLNL